MTNLGIYYQMGTGGLPYSDEIALGLYRRAAELGHATAMYLIGEMYRKGQGGLAVDIDMAVYWYRKAADLGHPKAKEELSKLRK